jgi:outer membrane protein W
MKKTITLLAVVMAFFTFSASAQISVGATIGAQMPLGDFGDGFNTGYGINAVGKYDLNEQMKVGLNIGYNSFGTDIDDISASITPITGLFEYYLPMEGFKPYVGADLGLYSIKVEAFGESSSDTYLGFAPTAGALYDFSEQLSFSANLKYNYISSDDGSSAYLGINVGVMYTL